MTQIIKTIMNGKFYSDGNSLVDLPEPMADETLQYWIDKAPSRGLDHRIVEVEVDDDGRPVKAPVTIR